MMQRVLRKERKKRNYKKNIFLMRKSFGKNIFIMAMIAVTVTGPLIGIPGVN